MYLYSPICYLIQFVYSFNVNICIGYIGYIDALAHSTPELETIKCMLFVLLFRINNTNNLMSKEIVNIFKYQIYTFLKLMKRL